MYIIVLIVFIFINLSFILAYTTYLAVYRAGLCSAAVPPPFMTTRDPEVNSPSVFLIHFTKKYLFKDIICFNVYRVEFKGELKK